MALVAFVIDLALQSLIFCAAAESVRSVVGHSPLLPFSRVQGCHALCLWPFSSLSASAFLSPGGLYIHAAAASAAVVLFAVTSPLFQSIFLFYFSL